MFKFSLFITILLITLFSCCLESCYAFLQADKLIYAGTVAKRPVTITVDSLNSATVQTAN